MTVASKRHKTNIVMKENRLYRIVNGKVIGGVAGGIAEFFGVDPTIIRIIFILLTIMGGGGLLIYIVLWIVVPEKYNIYPPYTAYSSSGPAAAPTSSTSGVGETYEGYSTGTTPRPVVVEPVEPRSKIDGSLIAGLILILIGTFFLFDKFFPQISFSDFWPLLLVLIGLLMIAKGIPALTRKNEPADSVNDKENTTNNDLNL